MSVEAVLQFNINIIHLKLLWVNILHGEIFLEFIKKEI